MKKTIISIISLLSLLSCIKSGEFSRTFPLEVTFEYIDIDYADKFGEDSLHFNTDHGYGIGWNYLTFRHSSDTVDKTFNGGILLSYLKGEKFDPMDSLSMAQTDSAAFADGRFRVNSSLMFYGSRTYAVFYGNSQTFF